MAPKNVILAALLALCVSAYGQTRSLLVDTSGVVQYTNTVQWQGALFFGTNAAATRSNLGALATNGSAAGLTNFPASLLTTNGSAAALSNFPTSLLTTNGNASALTNFPSLLLRTNGDAVALTNFPADLMRTNGNASTLTNFPASLLRTNGDGSGLTNLPNANLSNAIGVLPISNGGSGATNQADARTAFGLGSAATNDASAFQPASSALTNLATNNGGSLTNLAYSNSVGFGTAATNDTSAFQPASANLTNLANNDAAALTNFPSSLLRTNGDGGGPTNVSVDLNAVLPSYSNNAGKVLAVAAGATNVEWVAVSNTVTDASALTNYPAYLLQTNSALSAFPDGLLKTNSTDGSFPLFLARTNADGAGFTNLAISNVVNLQSSLDSKLATNGDASALTNFPTFNQNTTGTASNVTGVVAITNGGTGGTTASNARVNLLPSYSGNALRVLALDSNANDVVWAVDGGGQANLTNVTNTLAIANGGTGATTARGALTNFGILTSGDAVVIGGSNATGVNVVIGLDAIADDGSTLGSVAIGRSAFATNGGVAIGYDAYSDGKSFGGAAIGYRATNISEGGASIGYLARATNGGAIGRQAMAIDGFAGGENAVASATDAVQLGTGTITNANSIQFLSAGVVDTNEWARIAALSTYPTTNIQVTVVGGATNTLVFSNGILTSVTTP